MPSAFQTIAILGRQPSIGIAELERRFGAEQIQPFGEVACLIALPADKIPAEQLGGTVRTAQILAESSLKWPQISEDLEKFATQQAANIDGKITLGISVFDVKTSPKAIFKTALNIKKSLKKSGNSVRLVPMDGLALNSASVLHNKLTRSSGIELIVVSNGQKTIIAQTHSVQNIEAYAARDQQRPRRDAYVGMLPPKLAQIIINLAVGRHSNYERRTMDNELEKSKSGGESGKIGARLSSEASGTKRTESKHRKTQADLGGSPPLVLDPFCGTGVILQEAMLMDYDIYGSDLEPRMVEYSIDNLAWLDTLYPDVGDYRRVEVGDATTHRWHKAENITAVAAETYLGQPLSSLPPRDKLQKIIDYTETLHHKFLKNIAGQIQPGTTLCLAVPAWRTKNGFIHLKTIDNLGQVGYNRLKFKHVRESDLIYHRENQIVARELVVIIKN